MIILKDITFERIWVNSLSLLIFSLVVISRCKETNENALPNSQQNSLPNGHTCLAKHSHFFVFVLNGNKNLLMQYKCEKIFEFFARKKVKKVAW
jgi:hypothetical protein